MATTACVVVVVVVVVARFNSCQAQPSCSTHHTHRLFHPYITPPIHHPIHTSTADKRGAVGFWNLNGTEDDPIVEFRPHRQYVCGLKWLGPSGAGGLLTASYDGSVRRLDLADGGRWLLVHSSEEEEYSCCEADPSGAVLYLGDVEGQLTILDTRSPSAATPRLLCERKFNTLSLHPQQAHTLAAAVGNGDVAIWDIRALSGQKKKGQEPVACGSHRQTCQAAYFSPAGDGRIASTSRDNTVKIWDYADGAALKLVESKRHNNDTGRWILPFRAVWGAAGDCVLVGNMGRAVDLLGVGGEERQLRDDERMTAIPSRNAVHPGAAMIAAATGSGRVHVYH